MNLCSSAIYKLQHYFVSMWFVRNSSIYPHSIGQQITETDKSWNKIHRRTTRRLNLYSNDPYYYTITFNCWGKKKYDEWNFTSYVTLIFTSTFIWKLPFCFCWCEKPKLESKRWQKLLFCWCEKPKFEGKHHENVWTCEKTPWWRKNQIMGKNPLHDVKKLI